MRRLPQRFNDRNRKSLGGFVSLEVILVLPILLVLLMGFAEFALLFSARGQVVDAARAGVRLATLHGVDGDDVQEEIQRSLSPSLAQYARVDFQLGEYSGEEVIVRVRVPMRAATPDLLWPIGYSVRQRELIAEARMLKE